MHDWLLWTIVAGTVVLLLWRPRNISEAWWVSAGVALLLLFRKLSLPDAGHAVMKGTDVYLFLTGMMLLSELAREQGVFDWFAGHTVAGAHGSRARLFLLTYGVGTAVTALMSNDATTVVMTPAVLSAVRKAGVHDDDALPYLFACAMIANAASFLLPISNPANLVVFSGGALPPVGHWLLMFLLPSIMSVLVTYAVLRLWFRRSLAGEVHDETQVAPLSPAGRLVVWGIGVMLLVLLIASAMHRDLGAPTCVVALLLVAPVTLCDRSGDESFWQRARSPFDSVSWSVLPLVAGLFCIVEAVERAGALATLVRALQSAEHWPLWQSVVALGMGLGVGNNLVNNLPLGLLAGAAVQGAHSTGALQKAVLLGIDLGPNLCVTGSLATILWLLRLRRERINVSAWKFLKVGAVAMPLALAAALAMVFLAGR